MPDSQAVTSLPINFNSMAVNSFMKIFLPKSRVFYDLFEKVANNVAVMGSKLKQVVEEPDFDKRASLISQLEDLEHGDYPQASRLSN